MEGGEFLCYSQSGVRLIFLNVHEKTSHILHRVYRIEISIVVFTIDETALVVTAIVEDALTLWVFFFRLDGLLSKTDCSYSVYLLFLWQTQPISRNSVLNTLFLVHYGWDRVAVTDGVILQNFHALLKHTLLHIILWIALYCFGCSTTGGYSA